MTQEDFESDPQEEVELEDLDAAFFSLRELKEALVDGRIRKDKFEEAVDRMSKDRRVLLDWLGVYQS